MNDKSGTGVREDMFERSCLSQRTEVGLLGIVGMGIAAMFMKRTLKLEIGLASVEPRTGQIRWLWSGADAIMQDGLDNCRMPGANFAREFVSHCSGAAIRRA